MKRLLLLAFSCFLLLVTSTFAQVGGKFDTTFGKNGFTEIISEESGVGFATKRMDTDANGRIVTVADFYDEDLDEFFLRITRFDVNGKLDKTFGENNTGEVLLALNGFESFFMAMAVQADGKVIISALGEGSGQNTFSVHLYRLTNKGALDQTFGTDGFTIIEDVTFSVAALAIQPLASGDILLAGVVGDAQDETFFAMACKINNKGELIKTFGELGFFKNTGTSPSSLPLQFITDIAIAPNGSIIISGQFTDEDQFREGLIIRLTSAGKLDPTFSTTGVKAIKGFTEDVLVNVVGVDVQKDGKIIALVSTNDDVTTENDLVRLNVNGSTDLAFASQGKATVNYNADDLNFPIDLKILPNNQIVTAIQGYNLSSEIFYSAVNRYTTAGVLDKKFGDLGTNIVEIDSIEGVTGNLAIAPNNSIIVMLEGKEVVNNDGNYYQYFYRLLNPDVVGVKDEVVVLENVKIAPNPTFNTFTLSYNLEKNQNDVNIDLIDLEGRIIKSFANKEARQEGRNQELLDVSTVVSGIYFLKIQTAEQVKQVKVVKI